MAMAFIGMVFIALIFLIWIISVIIGIVLRNIGRKKNSKKLCTAGNVILIAPVIAFIGLYLLQFVLNLIVMR
ncbi:MAG: hypothetical protein ACI4J5_02710 [Oscillospiraceae bacterium]